MGNIDYWPSEEGYIVEGSPVMMCVAGGTITENACVKCSATTVGQVTVTESTTWGECIAVALRAASTGEIVPVAFEGIVKMLSDATLALGQHVASSAAGANKLIDTPTSANIRLGTNGTSWVMGTLLQAAATEADEVLLWIGRWT